MAKRAGILAAGLLLSACTGPFDADVRSIGRGFDTTNDVVNATLSRPQADARGVIAYPSYQVAVARPGDTPSDVAARLGVSGEALARHNGVSPGAVLRGGELLVLPGGGGGGAAAAPVPVAAPSGASAARPIDVTAIAGPAIDRAGAVAPRSGDEPVRHRVAPGETAFSIARRYDVPVESLAEWNALGGGYEVRVGQLLLIPTRVAAAPVRTAAATVTPPGTGSPTPLPPSAQTPLPLEDEAPEPVVAAPVVPKPEPQVTTASRLAMPAGGRVIRAYAKGKNEGIDIAAAAGSPVRAAEKGTVAAITRDTEQVPIIVIRHDGNLLTVYAGVDSVGVEKGDTVSRGQEIARVRAAPSPFLHFEVREGFESVDPMPFLN